MNFELNEEQALLRDTVRRFLAAQVEAAAIGAAAMPRGDWRAMGDLGLLAILLPEEVGGMSGGPQDAAVVAEELGRALAITPFAEAILGGADLVARYGTAAQQSRWSGPAAAGEAVISLAVGDIVVRDGILHGRCDFVRWAVDTDALVVVAGAAAHLVVLDAPSVTIVPGRLADGSPAATISFVGCRGEPLAVPANEPATTLALVQLGYVAEMIGIMALLYEQTAVYVRQRRQFGVPLGSFQVVQHKLARMFVALEQARSIVLKAAASPRDAPEFVRGTVAAKAYVAEAAQRLAEEAVQLHGGMGVTDELAIGRGLRRILVLARLFGTAEDARSRLAA